VTLRVNKEGYLVEKRAKRRPSKPRYKKAAHSGARSWYTIGRSIPDTLPCDPTLFGVAYMDVVLSVSPIHRVKNMGYQPEDSVYYSHEA
jgi:hypothetical protein